MSSVKPTIARLFLCIAGALSVSGASAASQSYMSLSGSSWVGTVESVRILSDYCSISFPQTADANKRAYEAWAQRNADLLASVQTQREHADRRLARQAAADPSAPKSTAELVALLEQRLSAQLREGNAEAQQTFCAKYPELISSTEKARVAKISSFLETVTEADEVLSEREKQSGG